MTRRRWLQAGIIGLAAAQLLYWLSAAAIIWATRYLLLDPSSAEASMRTRIAIGCYVILGINAVALAAFIVRRRGWSALVLAAAQACGVLLSLVATVAMNPAWLLLGATPALVTLVLIFQFLKTDDAMKRGATSEARSG